MLSADTVGYCEYCCMYWLARLLHFKRPLLSVDVSLCLCVTLSVCLQLLMLNISEIKRFRGSCPGPYRKVPTTRRLVTSSLTPCHYDVKLVTSQSPKSSHLETKTRINYPCGYNLFNHTVMLKISSFGLERWAKKSIWRDRNPIKIHQFSWRQQLPPPFCTICSV